VNDENEEDDKKFPFKWEQTRKDWLLEVPDWFQKWNLKVNAQDIDNSIQCVKVQISKWKKGRLNREGADIEDHTCGPALKAAIRMNHITWIFFLSFPWVAGYCLSCPATEGHHKLQLVGTPPWLWIPFLILVGILTLMEARAFKHSIVAQVVTSGIPMNGRFGFKWFLYIMLIISIIFHFDIFTNGVFMARVYKTEQCMVGSNSSDYQKIARLTVENIWHQTLEASALKDSFVTHIPYWGWAVIAWASLLLQPIYAYAYSLPLSTQLQAPLENDVESEEKKPKEVKVSYEARLFGTDCSQYHVVVRSDQQHGRALQAMSEAARMNSVYFLDPDYMHYQSKSWQPLDVHREMQRTNVRFFIFVVETIFPPNLQASFLAMEKAISGASDYIIFVSVMFSFLTGALYVRGELTTVFHFNKMVRKQKRKFDLWKQEKGASRELQFKATTAVTHATRSAIICVILASMGLFFLTRAVVTAYMGCFVCECGMWNFKGLPLAQGCVERKLFMTHGVVSACGK